MWNERQSSRLDEILDPGRAVRWKNGIVYPADGLSAGDLEFVEAYRQVRRDEGRGSDDPEFYLRLPEGDFQSGREEEWQLRRESLRWLQGRLSDRGPIEVLDAGAGNCWLTHHLANAGHMVVAVDVEDGEYDGLGAGEHYLRAGKVRFDRICCSFNQIPLRSRVLDLIICNGSIHYAEDLFSVIAEGIRLLKPEGEIVIMDSPLYSDSSSGERMVLERGGPERARYLVRSEIDRIAFELRLETEYIPRSRSPLEPFRRLVQRLRIGREAATMPWIILRSTEE